MAKKLSLPELKEFLDLKVDQFNRPGFIINDPVSIPHLFSVRQDIEIAGFFAAVLAWGQRATIIRKCKELLHRMDNAPHQFVMQHKPKELNVLKSFCHRTFNEVDAVYFIEALRYIYSRHESLENAFKVPAAAVNIEQGLINFHNLFFSLDNYPHRTRKHLPTPERKSTCKRLVMYLRWMVRDDNKGVDFGLWKNIAPSQLICPCDLHVDRVARRLKLIRRRQTDWQTAVELTEQLKKFDPQDPVKYDFALFGLGVEEGWK